MILAARWTLSVPTIATAKSAHYAIRPAAWVRLIEFPDAARARDWYDSSEYQEILLLRSKNSSSTIFIIDGVGPDHRATDVLRPPAAAH
mgnify:CR=1 FL=1